MRQDVVIKEIARYLNEDIFEPQANWPKFFYERRVIERWTATKIMETIIDNPQMDPLNVMSAFIIRMRIYKNLEGKAAEKFRIAEETAEDIILLFL